MRMERGPKGGDSTLIGTHNAIWSAAKERSAVGEGECDVGGDEEGGNAMERSDCWDCGYRGCCVIVEARVLCAESGAGARYQLPGRCTATAGAASGRRPLIRIASRDERAHGGHRRRRVDAGQRAGR